MRYTMYLTLILFLLSAFPLFSTSADPISSTIPSNGNYLVGDSSRNNGVVVWRFHSNFSYSILPPAVDSERGKIYTASYDGVFYALNLSGRFLWSVPIPSKTMTVPVVDLSDGTVYLHLSTGFLAAYSPEGRLLWKLPSKKYSRSWPEIPVAYPGGGVVFNANNTYVRASSDGRILATYNVCSGQPGFPPAVDENGYLYFISYFQLYCFRPNGSLVWKRSIPHEAHFSPVVSPTGLLYVVDRMNTLYCIYALNGSEKWRIPFRENWTKCLGLTPSGDPLVTSGDRLMRLSEDGDVLWISNVSVNGVVSDSRYIYAVGNSLLKLHMENGTVVWNNSNHPWRTSPVMDRRGFVYVYGGDSILYAVGPGPDYAVSPEDVIFLSNETVRWRETGLKVRVRNLGEDSFPACLYVGWRSSESPELSMTIQTRLIEVDPGGEMWIYMNWTPRYSGNGTLVVSVYEPSRLHTPYNATLSYVERVMENNCVRVPLYVREGMKVAHIRVFSIPPHVTFHDGEYKVRVEFTATVQWINRDVRLYYYVENTTLPDNLIVPRMFTGFLHLRSPSYTEHASITFTVDGSASGTHSISVKLMVPYNESSVVEPDTLVFSFNLTREEKKPRGVKGPLELLAGSLMGGAVATFAAYYWMYRRGEKIG